MLTVTLALGFGLWNLSRRLAPQITTPASLESNYVASFPEKSIAVLPFADLGDGKQDLVLADSVQDDILTALSKVADLRVISRTSASSYTPDKPRDLRKIAESLGAGHILQGTVSSAGEKARITVQLTDARRGAKLWTVSYERHLGDVLGIRSDILQRIVSQLNATVSPEEKAAIAEHPTYDLAAYALYVRGKALLASVSSAQINEKLLQAAQVASIKPSHATRIFISPGASWPQRITIFTSLVSITRQLVSLWPRRLSIRSLGYVRRRARRISQGQISFIAATSITTRLAPS